MRQHTKLLRAALTPGLILAAVIGAAAAGRIKVGTMRSHTGCWPRRARLPHTPTWRYVWERPGRTADLRCAIALVRRGCQPR